MKAGSKIMVVTAGVTAAAVMVFFFMAGGPEKPEKTIKKQTSTYKVPSPSLAIPATTPTGTKNTIQPLEGSLDPVNPAENSGVGVASTKEKIIEVIEEATVSYSASELPKIQPYLLHSDPEIRAAALEGMIQLGDAAAAPLLRAAAQLATSPEEADALREAAAFVELPSGSLLKKK
jgi:hypothetical protein